MASELNKSGRRAGRFDGLLICTDLDGTLLRDDKTVSRENLEAIEHFTAEGGYFTFITGRMPFFVGDLPERVRINAPFGCINGGGLYDAREDKYIWQKPIRDDVTELVRYIYDNVPGVGIQVNCFDKLYFITENEAMHWFRKITGVPNLVATLDGVDEPIAKIVFGDLREENLAIVKELLESHPRHDEFDYIRSERTLYEILPKGVGKGAVLPRLAEHLGIDMSRTIAFGDYDNDASMLSAAGLGVAVANATENARAAADLVTVSNNEHAIAKIIYDIENGKINI